MTVGSSLTIHNPNTTTVLTTSNVFLNKGCPPNTGYICYTTDILNRFEVGKSYLVYFEATTPDGVVIHSNIRRYTINNLNYRGITYEDLNE